VLELNILALMLLWIFVLYLKGFERTTLIHSMPICSE